MQVENGIHSFDLPRPMDPAPARPQTNEPVSVHLLVDEHTVLFGTGFEAGFDRLSRELDRFDGPDVIVVEHADPDHYDALPMLLERYPDANVAVPESDATALREAVGIEIDTQLVHDERRWGVRTIHVPGHTPGNMSFLHDKSGSLIVGDTFVHRNSFTAAAGDWSGEFAPIKPSLNADDARARENISVLDGYEFDAALVTHGLNVLDGAGAERDALVGDLGV